MQTPQVFRTTDMMFILNPNQLAQNNPTDEVSALLHHDIKTFLIENREPNLKVTYKEDLQLIAPYLKSLRG